MGYPVGYIDFSIRAYPTMPRLSALKIRQAKARDRAYKMYDERGLFLLVSSAGSKIWRFKYKYCGKEKQISFGHFPDVSLAQARELRAEARRTLANGVDPSAERKARRQSEESDKATFEVVAREWLAGMQPVWAASHYCKVERRLEREIFPVLGNVSICQIGPRDLLGPLQKIAKSGKRETARRTKQICGQVFRYAIATGRADRDLTADLKGALPPPIRKHHPTITDPFEIGALLRAIDGYDGTIIVRLALQFAPLVFTRPGELRAAEWSEINLERTEWRIPASRMKMRREQIVPLAHQAKSVLRQLYPYSRNGKYLFPGLRSMKRPMSENTLNGALRRLGYTSDEMTTHGFRSMASTLLNEAGWHRDAIERQLAHAEKDEIRAAYNYADYLNLRRAMMQAWADYLDALRSWKHGETEPRLELPERQAMIGVA